MGFYGSQWENVCYLWKIYKIIIINDNFFFTEIIRESISRVLYLKF